MLFRMEENSSTDSESASYSAFFDNILIFWKFFVIIAHFENFKSNRVRNGAKNEKSLMKMNQNKSFFLLPAWNHQVAKIIAAYTVKKY